MLQLLPWPLEGHVQKGFSEKQLQELSLLLTKLNTEEYTYTGPQKKGETVFLKSTERFA